MVIHRFAWLAAPALGLALSSVSCRVLVEDNCANQSVPGNEFCRELYGNAARYCSPCRRELNGCVENPPFSCRGYYDEVSEDEDDGPIEEGSSSEEDGGETGSSSSSGPATGSGSGSGSDGSGTAGSGSGGASTSG